jgi:hypothetical protein|tara:strand:+ start:2125 stop:3504 length:1380 start_codon:yes stop_codon:yes gene_type:complete
MNNLNNSSKETLKDILLIILIAIGFGTVTYLLHLLLSLIWKPLPIVVLMSLVAFLLLRNKRIRNRLWEILAYRVFPAIQKLPTVLGKLKGKTIETIFTIGVLLIIPYGLSKAEIIKCEPDPYLPSITVSPNNPIAKYKQWKCGSKPVKAEYTAYNDPRDLFYCIAKTDRPYVTQNVKEHFANNGYLATDIATSKSVSVYAPSFMYLDKEVKDIEIEYILTSTINRGTTGLTAILTHDNKSFHIGHMKSISLPSGTRVKTGDVIGTSGGCDGELQYGEVSTGCHIHLEYRVDGNVTPYPTYMYSLHGSALSNYKNRSKGKVLTPNDPLYSKFTKDKILPKLLSEMHQIETGRCVENCNVSQVGARGGMQFMPNTWKRYGCDGNADGTIDIENIEDSVCGATNYMESLYKNEKSYNNVEDKWVWWKSLYRYNAGYSKPASHIGGIAGGIRYADNIINLIYK